MRYTVTHGSNTVAVTDHLDVAELLREHSPYPVRVFDNWISAHVEAPVKVTDQLPWSTIDRFIIQNQKIQAIKLVREVTQMGLGEAKAVVDKRAVIVEKTERDRNPGF